MKSTQSPLNREKSVGNKGYKKPINDEPKRLNFLDQNSFKRFFICCVFKRGLARMYVCACVCRANTCS